MSADPDREYVDGVLRAVCEDFDAALEAAANGSVSARYAAVPSWYAIESSPTRSPSSAPVPTWCIDASTARRLLSEIRSDSGSGL